MSAGIGHKEADRSSLAETTPVRPLGSKTPLLQLRKRVWNTSPGRRPIELRFRLRDGPSLRRDNKKEAPADAVTPGCEPED
jgi:hypothetical protein